MNTNKLDIVREALRHTEERLTATNLVVTASETRILQFSAFNATIATVIGVNARHFPNEVFAVISATLLLFVTFLALSTVLPREFHTVGHFWRDWSGHIDDNDDLIDVLISQAEENDDRIDKNEAVLRHGASKFRHCYRLQIGLILFLGGSQLQAYFPPLWVKDVWLGFVSVFSRVLGG